MSATDELRKLLDERGVEWDYGISGPDSTMFRANGADLTFTPMRDGLVCSTILTTAQAVELTLGRGTCRVSRDPDMMECVIGSPEDTVALICDQCCCPFRFERGIKPHYCPNCGREVVE